MRNNFEKILEMLGVEVEQEFRIDNIREWKYRISEDRLLLESHIDTPDIWNISSKNWLVLIDISIQPLSKPPKFSEEEVVILKNIAGEYKYIGKDAFGRLFLSRYEDSEEKTSFQMYGHLFKNLLSDSMVSYWNIKDLLRE